MKRRATATILDAARAVLFAAPLLAFGGLVACGGGGATGAPVPFASAMPSPIALPTGGSAPQFVGYYLGWDAGESSVIPNGVTTVNVMPGFVNDGSADGSPGCTSAAAGHAVTMGDIAQAFTTANDIAALHARGIKALLTLGGSSPACAFLFDDDTAGFTSSLQTLFARMGFDGVDFDDETEPDTAVRTAHLVAMIAAVHHAMPAAAITLAVYDTPQIVDDGGLLSAADPITGKPIADDISWINVMTYLGNDLATTECDIADYVLGIPGYSAPFPASKTMVGTDIAGDPGIPVPTVATLQTLGSIARHGFTTGTCPNNSHPGAAIPALGGVMIWYINPPAGGAAGATPAEIQSIEAGLAS